LDLETFLIDLLSFFNDVLISGVNYLPMSIIKKLRTYSNSARNYNLLTLHELINKFIDDSNSRNEVYVDISIWLDTAIIEYENFSIAK
jgi:hypothetical protein